MVTLTFHHEQFNRLFPFYFIVTRDLKIKSCGKSIEKLFPDIKESALPDALNFFRPALAVTDFDSIKTLLNQLVVIELHNKKKTWLRGQFEYLEEPDLILFIGSPWFTSMDQAKENELKLDDFAYHDPLIDLIHVLKSHEIGIGELKVLLETVSKQKNDLKKNEEQLKVLSQIAEDNIHSVIITDKQGRITWANKSFAKMSGFEPAEFIGKKPGSFLQGPASDPETVAYLRYQIQNGNAFHAEIINYSKRGEQYWIRIQGQPVYNSKGEHTGFFALEENISREKKINEQIIESERKLRLALEQIGDNVWEHDFRTGLTNFTKSNNEFLGDVIVDPHSNEKMWWTSTHPDDRIKLEENDRSIRAGKTDSHSLEYRLIRKDGSVRWVLDRGVVIEKDPTGLPLRIIGTHTDITKIKETEAALAKSAKQFKSLSENIPAVIYEYVFTEDGSGHMRYVSPSMENVFGINATEFMMHPNKYIHPDDLKKIEIKNKISRKTLAPFNIEARILAPGKSVQWHLASSSFGYKTDEGNLVFTGIMLNTTDRKNAEDALRINEEKYRNIISNMHLGLLEVDREDVITFANESFGKMTGYSLTEMIGKQAHKLFLQPTNNKVVFEKNELRKEGFSDAYEILLHDRSGNARWVLVSGAPRYNDKGEFIGSIGIHLDITEHKKLEELLVKAKEEALQLAKTKELFLANMSHEIRTPLNAIVGMVRELKLTALTANQNLLLSHADASSSHLLSLVNNILDLSKINSGNFELDRTSFSLHRLFEEVSAITKQLAIDKSLEISFHLPVNEKRAYFGDPGRLRQVLINVIGNAIKFTEKGFVKVSLELTPGSEKFQEVLITVEDTGIGIDATYLNSLFEKFSQENNSIQRKYGGTGLGMAISKQIVEMMNGKIEVESEKGKGTVFRILISLEKDVNTFAEANDELNFKTLLEGKEILLVEDNEMNRFVAKNMLSRYGMKVAFAENGQIAVEKLGHAAYDLILMDLQMPVMDGLEATRVIRKNGTQTPIIALTANAFKNEIDQSFEAGMNDFASKPFDERVLLHKMVAAMKLTSAPDDAVKIISEKLIPRIDEKIINEEYLDSISDGSQEFKDQIFGLFLNQSEQFLKDSGKFLQHREFAELARLAHQFKPQGVYLGVPDLTEVVKSIEFECKNLHDPASLSPLMKKASVLIERMNNEIRQKLKTNS